MADVQPGLDDAPNSYPELLAWRDQSAVFDAVAASFTARAAPTGDGEPESLTALRAARGDPMLALRCD